MADDFRRQLGSPKALAAVGALALVACSILGVVAMLSETPAAMLSETPADARSRSSVCSLPLPLIVSTDVDVDDVQAIAYLLNSPVFDVQGIVVEADGFSLQLANVVNTMRLTQRYGRPEIPVAFGPLLSVRAHARPRVGPALGVLDAGGNALGAPSRRTCVGPALACSMRGGGGNGLGKAGGSALGPPARALMYACASLPRVGMPQMTSLNGKLANEGLPPDHIKPDTYLTEFVPLPFNSRPPDWRSGPALVIDLLKR